MKIMTILGTRPEIIRLSRIIPKLDASCEHVLVHTGQNFDTKLSDIFFEQLGVRAPDHYLQSRSESFAQQVARIITGSEAVMEKEQPDRLLILGDTNSGLSAYVAKRLGVPVYHMEAGNRCYDDRVPEEVNRRVIDNCCDILMPYTSNSKRNLLREGFDDSRIVVTGNPIYEVIQHYSSYIEASNILEELKVKNGAYFLVTIHREENVDDRDRLESLVAALAALQNDYGMPVVVSTHPRTSKRMKDFGLGGGSDLVRFLPPFGLFDFLKLEMNARCVLSDSGTVQEECCILKVRNVTLRDVTERPETIECGSNVLSGVSIDRIMECVRSVLGKGCEWTPPEEYLRDDVSDVVVGICLDTYTLAGNCV